MSTRLPILPANGPIPVLRAPERYDVAYPSGRRFALEGSLAVLRMPTGYAVPVVFIPTDDDGGGNVMVLDPRGVLCRGDEVVYDPRDYLADMAPDLAGWMRAHPHWPALLELGE